MIIPIPKNWNHFFFYIFVMTYEPSRRASLEIRPHGIIIPKTHDALQRKAIRDLTQWMITGRPGAQRRIPVTLYTRTVDGGLYVPSAWFRCQNIPYTETTVPKSVSLTFSGALRDTQTEAVSTAYTRLMDDGSATMVMRTGGGKTVCALALAHRLGLKTLILVHKTFLMNQWIERISQFLPGTNVTTVSGRVRDVSGDIVVGMFQTFTSAGIPVSGDVGLVIIDEAHHVAAQTFKNVMLRGSQKYTLGLSATPQRTDGLDIASLTGEMIDTQTPAALDTSRITVDIYRYTCDTFRSVPPTTKTGDINYSAMVSTLASLKDRTAWICSLIESTDRPTLILTHRRQHVEDMIAYFKTKHIPAEAFIPGVRDVPTSRIVVSTYQYASEGFDRHDLSCLVMATPIKSTTQSIGRICRSMHDESHTPLVIDIQDQWSVFLAGGAARRREYASRGYTVMVKRKPRDEPSRGSLFVEDS